jgi:hypothetical protein
MMQDYRCEIGFALLVYLAADGILGGGDVGLWRA